MTKADYILDTIVELCNKAGLSKEETAIREKTIYKLIENEPELWAEE